MSSELNMSELLNELPQCEGEECTHRSTRPPKVEEKEPEVKNEYENFELKVEDGVLISAENYRCHLCSNSFKEKKETTLMDVINEVNKTSLSFDGRHLLMIENPEHAKFIVGDLLVKGWCALKVGVSTISWRLPTVDEISVWQRIQREIESNTSFKDPAFKHVELNSVTNADLALAWCDFLDYEISEYKYDDNHIVLRIYC